MNRADLFRLPAIALTLAFASSPAVAQDSGDTVQDTTPADPRLQTRVYDEGAVVTIAGKVKVQTTIRFAPDEQIQNVAIGDSNAWQVQPNQAQSILFVKPLEPSARTNLTVVTSRRIYLFDLVASPRNQPLYVMQFRYPELEAAAAEAALAAAEMEQREEANAIELAAARDPYAVSDPAMLNFAWAGEGDRELLPTRAYDDGEALFLTWPEGTSIPAILTTNEDGDEGPVNFTTRGDTIVLDIVPRELILRSGRDTATLTNNGPVRERAAAVNEEEARGS